MKARSRVLSCLVSLVFALLVSASQAAPTQAQEASSQSSASVAASPKRPWGDFTIVDEPIHGHPWWSQVLLWLPNRVMDFIDIFRVDLGAGMSTGAVLRLTPYAQLGYRHMDPLSVRVGDFGRRTPILVESSDEYGIGPEFVKSRERKVCPGEVGVGLDLFIVGGYAGVCLDEVIDFAAGLFFLDLKRDDVR